MRINFSRKEILILLLSIVTSLFCFVQTQAEENDAQAPIIIVKGETIMTIDQGTNYVDEGVIAYDFQQGFITQYVTKQGSVNTSIPGVYTIRYSVRDADFNYAPEMTRTVNVIGEVAEAIKPIIKSHTVGELDGDTLKISFTTNQKTQAVIGYGIDGKYTMFSNPERIFTKTNHSQTLTDLELGKTYNYLIYVRNKEGKSNYVKGIFDTNGTEVEFKIISHGVESITSNGVKIRFESTEYSQAYVEYGNTNNYSNRTKSEISFKFREHLQSLSNLQVGTQYYYRIHVTNKIGKKATIDGNFKTMGGLSISSPTLIQPKTEVIAPYTISWIDSNPLSTRRYDIYVDGVDQGDSIQAPATSWTISNLSAGTHTVELLYWDNDKTDSIQRTSMEIMTKSTTSVKSQAYNIIKADIDDMFTRYKRFGIFDTKPAQSDRGYFSYTVWIAASTMHRITGDTNYMDKAIEGINYYIDNSILQSNGYVTWSSEYDSSGKLQTNNYHHEWRAGAGIAEVVIEMQRSGYEGSAGTRLKFTKFLEKMVWEKWQPGHTNVAQPNNKYVSNLGESGTWFVGRLALIAMALDQAQKRGDISTDSQYARYINSGKFSSFFDTYARLNHNGLRDIPWLTTKHDSAKPKTDTNHAGDIIYSVMRAHQLGYTINGKMTRTLDLLQSHINDELFVDANGWTPYTDGTGTQNGSSSTWPLAGAQGMAMTAIISPEIRDRWVEFYLNGNPAFNHQERRALQMAAGILAALAGEK